MVTRIGHSARDLYLPKGEGFVNFDTLNRDDEQIEWATEVLDSHCTEIEDFVQYQEKYLSERRHVVVRYGII